MHAPPDPPSSRISVPPLSGDPDTGTLPEQDDADHPRPPPRQLMMRLSDVMQVTGLGRSTIYRLMAIGRFPRPLQVTRRAVAWRLDDLERWMDSCPQAPH